MNWILVVLCTGSVYAEFDIDDTILYKIDFPGYQQKASKGNQLTDLELCYPAVLKDKLFSGMRIRFGQKPEPGLCTSRSIE